MTHDDQLDERFAAYRASGDQKLRVELLEANHWIAVHVARRFADRGEPFDDLLQVARLGLLKALDRFDPERGTPFVGFAMPTVLGEVRRYFRDATWAVRVPRRAKELSLEATKAVQELGQELGRSPTVAELARRMDIDEDTAIEALDAAAAYRASSLSAPMGRHDDDDSGSVEDGPLLSGDDEAMGLTPDRVSLHAAIAMLPERERKIVYLRFYEGLTQSEIAEHVGTSQVHVSRLLRASLEKLQQALGATTA